MEKYLNPTYFIDSDNPKVNDFARLNSDPVQSQIENAVQLYYAVRDQFRYDPYSIEPDKKSMKASSILKKGRGYCVAKAVLLAACARSQKIPARLGFADVQNHLNTERLKELMGTNIFTYHGYTEMFLNNKWVKATPAFNLELCTNFNVKPLEFDGTTDSIFHPCDRSGNKHMEYIRDHGTFSELPWDTLLSAMIKMYPTYFKNMHSGDFAQEALEENKK